MKTTPILVTGMFVFGPVLSLRPGESAQEQVEGRAVDEKAIKAVLAAYEGTWNQHDMKAWGKLFTDDVDYVNRAGGLWKESTANVEGHEAIHEALKKQNQKMTWAAAVEKISFISPDIALVHATWKWPGFTFPSGEEAKDFRGIITLVMVKQDGKWLIRALHNTVANAPPTRSSQRTTNEAAEPGAAPHRRGRMRFWEFVAYRWPAGR